MANEKLTTQGELLAALKDEIDPMVQAIGPCQVGLMERCRCETCRRKRSKAAIAKAESVPVSAGPVCPKCQGINLALYSTDDGFKIGYCNGPLCKYKGEMSQFFPASPSAPPPQPEWLEFGPNTPPNPGTYFARISSKDKAYMEWRDNKWLWDSGDGEPVQDFTAHVTHYKAAAAAPPQPVDTDALQIAKDFLKSEEWRNAPVGSAWEEQALASLLRRLAAPPQDAMRKALEEYDKAVTALTDQQLIDNPSLMDAVANGRAALGEPRK